MKLYLGYWALPEMKQIPWKDRARVWHEFHKAHGLISREFWLATLVFYSILAAEAMLMVLCDRMIIEGSLFLTSIVVVPPLLALVPSCAIYVGLLRKPFADYLVVQEKKDQANKAMECTH